MPSLGPYALGSGEHAAPERLPGTPGLPPGLGTPVHLCGHSQEEAGPPPLAALAGASLSPDRPGAASWLPGPTGPLPPPGRAHVWPAPPGPPSLGASEHPALPLRCLHSGTASQLRRAGAEIQGWTPPVPSEALRSTCSRTLSTCRCWLWRSRIPWLRDTVTSGFTYMGRSPWVHIYVRISPFHRDAHHIGLRPLSWPHFNL